MSTRLLPWPGLHWNTRSNSWRFEVGPWTLNDSIRNAYWKTRKKQTNKPKLTRRMNTSENSIHCIWIRCFRTPNLRIIDKKHLFRRIFRQAWQTFVSIAFCLCPFSICLEQYYYEMKNIQFISISFLLFSYIKCFFNTAIISYIFTLSLISIDLEKLIWIFIEK